MENQHALQQCNNQPESFQLPRASKIDRAILFVSPIHSAQQRTVAYFAIIGNTVILFTFAVHSSIVPLGSSSVMLLFGQYEYAFDAVVVALAKESLSSCAALLVVPFGLPPLLRRFDRVWVSWVYGGLFYRYGSGIGNGA